MRVVIDVNQNFEARRNTLLMMVIILLASTIILTATNLFLTNETIGLIKEQNQSLTDLNQSLTNLNQSLTNPNATNTILPKTVVVWNGTIEFYDNMHNLLPISFLLDVSKYHKVWIYYEFVDGSPTHWYVRFELPNINGLTVATLNIIDVPYAQVTGLDIQGPYLHINCYGFDGPYEWTSIIVYLYLT
ncbi:MAG: hypothetical protein OEZ18_06835 [Candidatus Bathyarchaeota archaeon]|nr:hypothetical protein [Candidatus Bathyarchaeota archaeon]